MDTTGVSNAARIVVHSKPMCVQCNATYRMLDKLGLEYETIDVTKADEALQYLKSLGYQAAPVVLVYEDDATEPTKHWSGYRPDELKRLSRATVAA